LGFHATLGPGRDLLQPERGSMEQEVEFDKPEQLQKIQEGLLPEERVYADFDLKGGGTGFIGITDKRVII
jgi:hypothetical protein